ncbi:MAG: hypothetical protein JJE05_11635, partial [Actinobacteria bacterium]|nr:hypothetical protein [Actinomycetota bacterium]
RRPGRSPRRSSCCPTTSPSRTSRLAERVAPYKKIRLIEKVDEIPKSASGKILRRVLVERERSGA